MSSEKLQNRADSASFTQVNSTDIEQKPWKFVGYRGYADLIASEDDFFILRQFNTTNIRVALMLQDEVTLLEQELVEMDDKTSRKDSPDIHNGSFRQDRTNRTRVLYKLRRRLKEYNEFVLQLSQIKKLQPARSQDIRSLRNWHYNHDYVAILKEEQDYLRHEKDLFCVVQKDKMPLRRLIDNSRWLRTLPVWRSRGETSDQTADARAVSHYSENRINSFVASLIVALGGILLLAPLWTLYVLKSTAHKLAVITVFVAIFLVTLSLTLTTKPFEALGATAAYAAVLTVFLQIGVE